MNVKTSLTILTLVTPYIVLIVTLIVQYIQRKHKEIPNLRCTVKCHPAMDIADVIVCIKNISPYTAYNIRINPEYKVYSANCMYVKTDSLSTNEEIQLQFPQTDGNFKTITITYFDEFKKKHQINYSIKISDPYIYDDYRIEIKTEKIK